MASIERGRGYAALSGMARASMLMWLALGCAEGLPGPEASVSGSLGATPPLAGMPAIADDGGTAGMGAGMGAAPRPVFMGEQCTMGQTQTCTCEDGVSQGTKTCRYERESPTQGAFGPCSACQQAGPAPGAGSGAAGMGGSMAGTGGGSGTGSSGTGSSGTGSSGTGSSGTGASGTGASGMGSSGAGGMPPPAGCNPRDCDQPLLGSACCTDDDECGVRLLLSCNAR